MSARFSSEQEALDTSTGFHGKGQGRFCGYLSLEAANYLVSTGHWHFFNAHCWGYILERA